MNKPDFSRSPVFMAALAAVLSFLCVLPTGEAVRTAFAAERTEDDGSDFEDMGTGENSHEKSNEDIIIVIDPGHGGKNEGALWKGYTEKNLTMITARAMKEHLEKFEGVKVIFTHENTEDDMSIEDRAKFAAKAGADYLFCLHYNMSSRHTHYGAEMWIPRKGDNNRTGYQFARIEMDNLKAIGLSDRGIKTRRNSKGEDYYGIIRYSEENNVPCVLIEHAHLDHQRDSFFTDEKSDFVRFGRIDAESVAMFYGLKSEELGEDYSTKNYRVEVSSKKTYGIPSENLSGDYVIDSNISPVEDPAKLEGQADGSETEGFGDDLGSIEADGEDEAAGMWGGLTDLRGDEDHLLSSGDEDEEIYREADDEKTPDEGEADDGTYNDEPREILFDIYAMSHSQRIALLAVLALIIVGVAACLVATRKK